MCVIVGVKLPRNPDGSPADNAKWRLGKIRDRTYVPTFNVKRWSVNENGSSQLFLVDQDTDWTEGCSVSDDGKYLGIVNAALNNKSDKKDTGRKRKSVDRGLSRNGVVLRKALKQATLEDAVSVLVDNRIDGNTFVTDGDRLFCLEIYIPKSVKEKYKEHVENSNKKYEDLIQPEEYIVSVKEIKEHIIVRTNHGVFDPSGGYTEEDGDLYKSSSLRRKYASNTVRNKVFQPIDLIVQLTRLGSDDIDSNPFYRPVRLKGIAKSKHSDVEIFSTATIMLDPSGTIFLRPIECKIGDISLNKLTNKKRKTNLVVLPSHIPLFEKDQEMETDNEKEKDDKKDSVKDTIKNIRKNKYINTEPELKLREQAEKTAVISFGRMNPPTNGHEKLVKTVEKTAKEVSGVPMVFLSHSTDKKKNPLTYDQKIKIVQNAFGSTIKKAPHRNIIEILTALSGAYTDIIIVVGQDRIREFEILSRKYNGNLYNFDSIEVKSAGDRDPDAEDVTGMSASKMRAFAIEGSVDLFKSGLPSKVKKDAEEIMDMVRAGMGLREDLEFYDEITDGLNEQISRQTRIKRANLMRRRKNILRVARRRALRKKASRPVLQKRARKRAISSVKRQVSGGRRTSDLSYGQRSRAEMLAKKRSNIVNVLSRRKLRDVKSDERRRLTNSYEIDDTHSLLEAIDSLYDIIERNVI